MPSQISNADLGDHQLSRLAARSYRRVPMLWNATVTDIHRYQGKHRLLHLETLLIP